MLWFGRRAYKNNQYSQIVLHKASTKFQIVIKYVGFAISVLLFLLHLLSFENINFALILQVCGIVALAVYLLFYAYKKPSCLFSAALIFIGISYLYSLANNFSFYIRYLSELDNYILHIVLNIIPVLITGILYIVIATKLYKENYTVTTIKTMGWIAFSMELSSRVLCNLVISQDFAFLSPRIFFLNLLPVVLFLYLCVFEVNDKAPVVFEDKVSNDISRIEVLENQWQCSCGKIYPKYVSSCVCGKSKTDIINQSKFAEALFKTDEIFTEDIATTTDQIRFCRKCGNKLLDNSKFCSKCGTEIISE